MSDTPTMDSTLDITPSPRVLEMLGEIEFAPWRCAAELLDNSIDGFLDLLEDEPDYGGPMRVNIVLPRTNDPAPTASITVVDTGPGMTLDQVNNAVRAGFSGNDPFDNLGLFGMGFNIATARLGNRTRVLTTREGETEWHGVDIDLAELQSTDSFEVPIVHEPKDDPSIHGTKVIVSRLRPGNYEELSRSPRKLADVLGDAYAPLLLSHPRIEIRVNNTHVEARRYCRWSPEREVKYGSGASAEVIPAVVEFDEKLPDRAACRSCRRWQESPVVDRCEFCGSDELDVKERRIHGWVGVQRYLHPSDYGIDFIRNGRKILIRDKSLFRWVDPNDVSNTELIEYPIEPPANEGRLIGEVHIDHVPVEYRKETFRQDSPEWQAVRRFLRGDGGPMRPQYRTERQMDRFADGPLAKLYKAFNANRPGARHLIPAAPKGPALHDKAREWGKKFHDGNPDYEDDTIWWRAIEVYEKAKQGESATGLLDDDKEGQRAALVSIFGDDAFTDETEDDGDTGGHGDAGKGSTGNGAGAETEPDADEQRPETYLERVERYAKTYPPLPELEFNVALPGALQAVDLTTYLVDSEEVLSEENVRVPVHAFLGKLNALNVFVDANHPLFTQYDTQVADIVLAEVADLFRGRFDSTMTLGQIISRIKAEKLSDRRLDDNVAADADAVLRRIRAGIAAALSGDSDGAARAVALLTQADRSSTETSAASEERKTFDEAVADGTIALYVPALALPRMVADMPERFLDGKVFTRLYDAVGEAPRRIAVAQLVGYLYDIGILADRPVRLRGEALRRAALSVRLIEDELSDDVAAL
jgi:hypothetical protein